MNVPFNPSPKSHENPLNSPFPKEIKKQTKPKHRKTKLSHNNQIGKANCEASTKISTNFSLKSNIHLILKYQNNTLPIITKQPSTL